MIKIDRNTSELSQTVCRNINCTLGHLLVLYEHTFIHSGGGGDGEFRNNKAGGAYSYHSVHEH